MKKFLFGLTPVLLVAAFALAPAGAAASAPCTTNVVCDGSNNGLRDDLTAPPTKVKGELGEVAEGGFGTSLLAVNTGSPWRFTRAIAGSEIHSEVAAGYVFLGLKLDHNPATSGTKCEEATGWVDFVNISRWTSEGRTDPAYGGEASFKPTLPAGARGGLGPWTVSIKSEQCKTEPGKVTISNVSLYLPKEALTITGTLIGRYMEPNVGTPHTCPAGGVEIATGEQAGLKLSAGSKPEFDNGTGGKPAFICNVVSNNWFFPKTAPTWGPFEDFNASAEPGMWQD
jgi:hypothetical protein